MKVFRGDCTWGVQEREKKCPYHSCQKGKGKKRRPFAVPGGKRKYLHFFPPPKGETGVSTKGEGKG